MRRCGSCAALVTSGVRRGGGPGVGGVFLGRLLGLRRVGDGPLACAVFRSCFPHRQDFCVVFGPGLPYKLGQFYLLYEL